MLHLALRALVSATNGPACISQESSAWFSI
jgi:hypothetical protein